MGGIDILCSTEKGYIIVKKNNTEYNSKTITAESWPIF